MKALERWLAVCCTAIVITVLSAFAPIVFRRMETFRVERIEVSGARYMSAQAALAATGITDSSSVFDDVTGWTDSLLARRLIDDARILRKLPRTLRIELVEAEPVAFVRTPELRPVDAKGRLLPIEPAGQHIDVPVIIGQTAIGVDSTVDAETARLIDGLVSVRLNDEGLMRSVSEVGYAPGGGLLLVLRYPRFAQILLPESPSAHTFQQIRLAVDHLQSEQDGETESGRTAFERLARIDARFADELFVTLRSYRAN